MAAPASHAFEETVGVEERLAALARARGPLRRVLATLAARFVARRGWQRLSYANLSDHARARLGVSGRTMQDLARVGARLGELPRLEAALASGRLPWSKVRLLARFVAPENEARWIAYAFRARVRTLERELRAVDRGAMESGALACIGTGAEAEGDPMERVRIRGPTALAFKWHRTREYASRTVGSRLPAGALLEMVTAETLSALPLAAPDPLPGEASARARPWPEEDAELCVEVESESEAGAGLAVGAAPDALSAPALPAFLRPLLEDLDAADAFDLEARLRRAFRLEQRLDAQLAPLLRVVACSSYSWRLHHPSLAAFARERLGISPRKARALLRLERVGDACPALRRAWREGAISWVQAQILAPLMLLPGEGSWREAWLAHAAHVSVRALDDHVADALLAAETAPGAWAEHRGHPERFAPGGAGEAGRAANVCASSDRDEGVRLAITAPQDVARLFRGVLCSLRRALERQSGRLPSEGEAFDAMLDHALQSWGASDPWLARRMRKSYPVFERDGWRCTVPGCSSRRNLHAHHIVFRSAGGSDALSNQTTLCAFHHQRGVHDGRLRVQGHAPGGLSYELGLRPGLPPLERYRSHDWRDWRDWRQC